MDDVVVMAVAQRLEDLSHVVTGEKDRGVTGKFSLREHLKGLKIRCANAHLATASL